MRNRASELRIPRSDSLPLSHRLHGERDIFCIWSFCIKWSVVKVPNLFPFRIPIFTSIQRSPPRSLQRSAARGTGLSPVKAWIFSGFFSAIVRNISLFDFIRKFSKKFLPWTIMIILSLSPSSITYHLPLFSSPQQGSLVHHHQKYRPALGIHILWTYQAQWHFYLTLIHRS